mmetsp:Transcript_87890/g.253516  ORF Transcript_87890/g.253516 Transcript_87890/m.253516 type:complete len:86 (+) Transcript_87890:465-722(+)
MVIGLDGDRPITVVAATGMGATTLPDAKGTSDGETAADGDAVPAMATRAGLAVVFENEAPCRKLPVGVPTKEDGGGGAAALCRSA